jgi:hypothetical protein
MKNKSKKSPSKERTVKVKDLKASERSEGPKAGAEAKIPGTMKWGDITLKRG